MRLATVRTPAGPRAAVVRGAAAVPLDAYADVGALLADGGRGLTVARDAAARTAAPALESPELLRPVLAPGAVVCVGLNYRTHILEMGRELPEQPTLFAKLPRTLTDPGAEIEMTAISDRFDYEAELAVVIGRGGRHIAAGEALEHVAGFTVLNDVTARDLQWRTTQWFAGKNVEASTPLGPWVVTPDEVGELGSLEISLTVNGEERQRASLGDLVFDVPTLIADLSRIVELQPGDIIATGTPGGVGDPQGLYIEDGDTIEATIDRVGTLRNVFRREAG